MIKEFSILSSLILLMIGFISLHYFMHSGERSKALLGSVSRVTQFSSPSLSVNYYEPRVLFYDASQNPAYPQMQPIDKMDFVYEK